MPISLSNHLMEKTPIVFVIVGPTAVGKTSVSLELARHLNSPVINADSRQMFRDIPIGTAAPTAAEQGDVEHYFVGNLGLEDYYSASRYETEALQVIGDLIKSGHDRLVVSGGSMMYVDALCYGIDPMPDIRDDIRQTLKDELATKGLEVLVAELQQLDPVYAATCDLRNPVRVVHALEIIRQTGTPYSDYRNRQRLDDAKSQRPFRVVRIGLDRPREELFDRINRRVTQMVETGFIDEARRVAPWRHCNSLNTVGYKEIFRYLDGEWPLDMALDRIRKNTRVYAKKQLTWLHRDSTIHWFHPDNMSDILRHVDSYTD